MATVRIFLLTYRRPELLERALSSLLSQTFADWICELHNDDPADDSPGRLVERLGDKRIVYRHHRERWGAVRSFNHAYAGGPEPFASILEDDNWWEPDFLRRALQTSEENPNAALVWSNMWVWTEEIGGRWTNTRTTVWQDREGPSRGILWPQPLQAFDALHSQGAMVFRPQKFADRAVPAGTPLAIIEALRERSARGELVLIPHPLANFAVTRTTARSQDRSAWQRARILLIRTFMEAVAVDAAVLNALWKDRRSAVPPDTGFLIFAGLSGSRALLKGARAGDWARFLASALRHPLTASGSFEYTASETEVLNWLRLHTCLHQMAPGAPAVFRKR